MSKKQNTPEYIMIELGNRNYTIAKRIVGYVTEYIMIATCRSRAHAQNLVKLLNGGK